MSKITLYHATELSRIERFVDEDGVFDELGFEDAQAALLDKQLALVAHIKNESAQAEMLNTAIKRLDTKHQNKIKSIERLKEYLMRSMAQNGTEKITAPDGSFSAKVQIRRDASIEIEPFITFEEQYLMPLKPREPSKTLIKKALEAGVEVLGARIVYKDRLTII